MKRKPRDSYYFGQRTTTHFNPDGTWIEPEALTYPSGGFKRRAYVYLRENSHAPIELPYNQMRIVWCSTPDTYFSIPAKLRHKGKTITGYISTMDNLLTFTPDAIPQLCTVCASDSGCKQGVK